MRHRQIAAVVAMTLAAGLAVAGAADPASGTLAAERHPAIGKQATGHEAVLTGAHPLTSRPVAIPALAGGAPSLADCLASGVDCYDPAQLRAAYGLDGLFAKGDEGRGQTIVLIDAFGSPTLGVDLGTFDLAYGIPNPPNLEVYAPYGTTKFTAGDQDEISWATETTLDVEWAHAMAPEASIDLLTSPVDESEGTVGLGDFAGLARFAVVHHLGRIVSQSWGVTEQTLLGKKGRALVRRFERTYELAARDRITVLAAAGDDGSANPSNSAQTEVYRYPTVDFPSSSPWVTSIGGTHLSATPVLGLWQSEEVWNDTDGSGGGGLSRLFAEPGYQQQMRRSKQDILQGRRGVPDVSWDSDPATGVAIYQSFDGTPGWDLIGGTSAATPQWAGLVADIDQARHRSLGFLNPELYLLGRAGHHFHDIVGGNNGYEGIGGYPALPGWDAATGWGTPRWALISSLIAAPVGT